MSDPGQADRIEGSQVALVAPPGTALDPAVALATSVHASPGVYALLLGSGVSSAAGIPTGWQVVQDLVGRLAAALDPADKNAAVSARDEPEEWWAAHGDGKPLGYSGLLGAIARTPAARRGLLAGYFEPSPEDIEEGRKAPSAAHRAIAQLVARGSVRVILTTNFDRLTERALEDIGVSPQVIYRSEQIRAATPLVHAKATVVKLHGDYADLDQRNTIDELASYSRPLSALLSRVLDEYGLIVSGWSAEWDTALVKALEQSRSRRYPLFWSSYGHVTTEARRLIAQHGAVNMPSQPADDLFAGLVVRLEALDQISEPPISAEIAIQRVKRAIPNPQRRVELFDLVDGPVQRLVSFISDRQLHPIDGTGPSLQQLQEEYERETELSARLLATGVFYGADVQDELWLRSFKKVLAARGDSVGGVYAQSDDSMRHYPALLCLWSMGVAAVLSAREKLLGLLLTEPRWTSPIGRPNVFTAGSCLNPMFMPFDEVGDEKGRHRYPRGHRLRSYGRRILGQFESNDEAFEVAADRFEYIASMVAMDGPDMAREPWLAEFLRRATDGDRPLTVAMEEELARPDWPLLESGAFRGSAEQAKAANSLLISRIRELPWPLRS